MKVCESGNISEALKWTGQWDCLEAFLGPAAKAGAKLHITVLPDREYDGGPLPVMLVLESGHHQQKVELLRIKPAPGDWIVFAPDGRLFEYRTDEFYAKYHPITP